MTLLAHDAAHWHGEDLAASVTGDLAIVNRSERGRQRVIRRLLTNPRDVLHHPTYGAGVRRYVGSTAPPRMLALLVRAEVGRDAAVARFPAPDADAITITDGVSVTLTYTDAVEGVAVNAGFDLSA
jgi:hypothetical protein